MLSDSPPDRDVIWTEEGVQGAWRFVQRLWRLVGEIADIAKAPAARPAAFGAGSADAAQGRPPRARQCLRRHRQAALQRCVAHIYEFANALNDAHRRAPRRRAGARSRLGDARGRRHPGAAVPPDDAASGRGMLGDAGPHGPGRRRGLAAGRAAICWSKTPSRLPVQINGKKRADVTVARDAANAEIEAAVLALDAVKKALDGKRAEKGHRRPAKDRQCGGLRSSAFDARLLAGVLALAGLTAGCFQPLYGDARDRRRRRRRATS